VNLIKSYNIEEKGLSHFIIRDSWQIAKLNYSDEQKVDRINQLKMHKRTDRGCAILKGKAIIISKDSINGNTVFQLKLMKVGRSYNILKNTWYNIVMQDEGEILIVDKSNTHLNDVAYLELKEEQLKNIIRRVYKKFKSIENE